MNSKVETAINKQIQKEEFSSRLYLAMAIWCEVNGYPGASTFLYHHSEEERLHQMKLIHYVNKRGGKAELDTQEQPATKFISLQETFEQVLGHEEYITRSINELYELTLNEKDFTTGNFLQWYITEQHEEESMMHTILDKIKLAGADKSGMFHIDKELATMTTTPDTTT